MNGTIKIYGQLESATTDNILATADQIYDDGIGMYLSDINKGVATTFVGEAVIERNGDDVTRRYVQYALDNTNGTYTNKATIGNSKDLSFVSANIIENGTSKADAQMSVNLEDCSEIHTKFGDSISLLSTMANGKNYLTMSDSHGDTVVTLTGQDSTGQLYIKSDNNHTVALTSKNTYGRYLSTEKSDAKVGMIRLNLQNMTSSVIALFLDKTNGSRYSISSLDCSDGKASIYSKCVDVNNIAYEGAIVALEGSNVYIQAAKFDQNKPAERAFLLHNGIRVLKNESGITITSDSITNSSGNKVVWSNEIGSSSLITNIISRLEALENSSSSNSVPSSEVTLAQYNSITPIENHYYYVIEGTELIAIYRGTQLLALKGNGSNGFPYSLPLNLG